VQDLFDLGLKCVFLAINYGRHRANPTKTCVVIDCAAWHRGQGARQRR
jgi:hypothetical protein